MKRFLLSILILLPLCAAAAELTLDSCLNLARQNNPDILTSRLDVDRAMEVKKQVFTKYFPQVQGTFLAYHSLHHLVGLSPEDVSRGSGYADLGDILQRLLDEYNKQNSTSETEVGLMKHGLSVGATAVQPVFMGGRVINANRLAQVGVDAAKTQAQVTERDVLENIESSFYLVIGLEQKTRTVESALSLLDSLDRTAHIAYDAGVVTRSDLLQVSLKRNEMLAKQQQLQSGIVLARRLLCMQIGLPYSDTLSFADSNEESLIRPLGNPERWLLTLNVRAEKLRKRITIGEALPQVMLGGTYYYGNAIGNGNLMDHSVYKHNGLLFASATVPLTGWWETSHKIREHNILIRKAEITQQQMTDMIDIRMQKAFTDWQQAEALLRSDSAALEMAEENYRLALLNYESGIQTLNDVLQANTLLLQAQDAITDRRITLAESRRRYRDLCGE